MRHKPCMLDATATNRNKVFIANQALEKIVWPAHHTYWTPSLGLTRLLVNSC